MDERGNNILILLTRRHVVQGVQRGVRLAIHPWGQGRTRALTTAAHREDASRHAAHPGESRRAPQHLRVHPRLLQRPRHRVDRVGGGGHRVGSDVQGVDGVRVYHAMVTVAVLAHPLGGPGDAHHWVGARDSVGYAVARVGAAEARVGPTVARVGHTKVGVGGV